MILARGYGRSLTDALPAAECRQRWIRQFRAAADEFFMDSHEIPLAGREKIQDQDGGQQQQTQARIESARRELDRMTERIGKEQETQHAEPAQRTAILELSARMTSPKRLP